MGGCALRGRQNPRRRRIRRVAVVADTANTRPMKAGATAIRCNVIAISYAAAETDYKPRYQIGERSPNGIGATSVCAARIFRRACRLAIRLGPAALSAACPLYLFDSYQTADIERGRKGPKADSDSSALERVEGFSALLRRRHRIRGPD
jgi:hypothetical protein